jgi:hypothetical protein
VLLEMILIVCSCTCSKIRACVTEELSRPRRGGVSDQVLISTNLLVVVSENELNHNLARNLAADYLSFESINLINRSVIE